jgi:hypothetical protein
MFVLVLIGLLHQAPAHDLSEIIGTWQGTSTCTDRVASPACNDEVIVYEITKASAPGTATWKAFKIINGARDLMGELELRYSPADRCWRADFSSPRVTMVWCLAVNGAQMTGSGWSMPGKRVSRAVKAKRSSA